MYKGASRAMQHAHRVNRPLPTGGYIDGGSYDDDLLPAADNMSLSEVRSEQRQLRADQLRYEADLSAAKACGNKAEAKRIGQVISVICKRAGPLRVRAHSIIQQSHAQSLGDAIREMLSPEMAKAVFDRAKEIAANSTPAS